MRAAGETLSPVAPVYSLLAAEPGWGSAALEAAETQPASGSSRSGYRSGGRSSRRPSIGDLSPVARRALQATLAVGSSKKRVEPMQIEGDLTLPSPRS